MMETVRKAAGRIRELAIHGSFLLFDRLLPVRDDYWCFGTWDRHPHTLDNPRAVFEEVKNDPSIRKIILQKRRGELEPDGTNIHVVPAESLASAYYLARSRVLLTGYALRGVTSFSRGLRASRHHVIQLWHGIPLKRIGHLFPGETMWDEETPKYAATVCSAERDQEIMAQAFAPVPRERVWLTGLPRNDLILKEETSLPADYLEQLAQLDLLTGGRRLVLYAPTWREREESLYVFSAEEEVTLERVLEKHGAVLAIRGHANVRRKEAYSREQSSPAIVSVNDFPEANTILRRTDVLITDYSSIYIDYLVLDRPIVHFAYDLDDYVQERGFLYDLDDAFGGPCARDFDDLILHLDEALQAPDHHQQQRASATALFHGHSGRSAAAVFDLIRALPSP